MLFQIQTNKQKKENGSTDWGTRSISAEGSVASVNNSKMNED